MQLLAKLMVSSEQVAATVLGRGPSAALTGVLSRMSSVAGSGAGRGWRFERSARDYAVAVHPWELYGLCVHY